MTKKPEKRSPAHKETAPYSAAAVPFDAGGGQEALQEQLCGLAREISNSLSNLTPAQSKELLGTFVSELFFCVAEEERRKVRRQKQAEGIAKAKARGVHFGPEAKPLPDNFSECYQSWQNGEITASAAAQTCGMSRKSFCRAVERIRDSAERGAQRI